MENGKRNIEAVQQQEELRYENFVLGQALASVSNDPKVATFQLLS